MMWMTLASNLTPFLKYWKTILIVVAFVAAAGGGYQLAKLKYEAQKARELQAVISHYQSILEKNKRINKNLRAAIEEIRGTERVITEKVIEYVETNPDRVDCELDADGLSLWNSTNP